MLIVILVRDGPLRFNALRRAGGGITQRMLARTLRGLEHDGFVIRTVDPAKPPQVKYALMPLEQSLRERLEGPMKRAFAHINEIDVARDAPQAATAAAEHRP